MDNSGTALSGWICPKCWTFVAEGVNHTCPVPHPETWPSRFSNSFESKMLAELRGIRVALERVARRTL